MDLRTAVAASTLPASRARVAALVKELRQNLPGERGFLERVLDALGFPQELQGSAASTALGDADIALAAAAAAGFQALCLDDPPYPALLRFVLDPPPVLWISGDSAVLGRPAVAIVGSRAATPYALDVARRLGRELASRGIIVVSGLARGVDSAAHRGCLEAGGQTVAVLGSGLDRVYPHEHRDLAATISKQGALLSELAPGGPPLPEHFPLRNRIISGISLAVVVVEASEKSGSLITARCALEQGRDVMAVPGSVLSGRNRGSHSLLKDGAKVVETADDILDGLGWASPVHVRPAPASENSIGPAKPVDPLLRRMDRGESYGLDELVELTGTSPARLLTRLTELELSGMVAGQAGRWKVLT